MDNTSKGNSFKLQSLNYSLKGKERFVTYHPSTWKSRDNSKFTDITKGVVNEKKVEENQKMKQKMKMKQKKAILKK